MTDDKAKEIALKLGLESRLEETVAVIHSLYNAFVNYDASLIEINPYAEDTYGKSNILPFILILLDIFRFCVYIFKHVVCSIRFL